ncbi:hypothetical protein TIFTF001_052168, partial [Ficus carica]
CRSRRTRTADQNLSSHQGARRTGLDYAPSTLPRGITSHRHPPPLTLTGSAPAGAGDNNPTVPCTGLRKYTRVTEYEPEEEYTVDDGGSGTQRLRRDRGSKTEAAHGKKEGHSTEQQGSSRWARREEEVGRWGTVRDNTKDSLPWICCTVNQTWFTVQWFKGELEPNYISKQL